MLVVRIQKEHLQNPKQLEMSPTDGNVFKKKNCPSITVTDVERE